MDGVNGFSMNCPYCHKNPASSDERIRPFCSERCKKLDLGNWAAERYRVAGEPVSREIAPVGEESDAESGDD